MAAKSVGWAKRSVPTIAAARWARREQRLCPPYAASAISRCAAHMNVLLEIPRKPVLRRGQAGIFAKMRHVRPIAIGQAERPTAVFRDRDRLDVEAGQCTGGQHRI